MSGAGFTRFRYDIGTKDCNVHGSQVAASIGGRQFAQTARAHLNSIKENVRTSYGYVSIRIAGLEWVLGQPGKNKRVHMSLTRMAKVPASTALLDLAVLALIDAGVLVMVGAGNFASAPRLFSTARNAQVITVGTMQSSDMTAQSNFGECVDLHTEGTGILLESISRTNAQAARFGTSMPTPRVSEFAGGFVGARHNCGYFARRPAFEYCYNYKGSVCR